MRLKWYLLELAPSMRICIYHFRHRSSNDTLQCVFGVCILWIVYPAAMRPVGIVKLDR